MGSQRVGQDWSDLAHTHTLIFPRGFLSLVIFPDCFPGSSDSKESVWNAGDPGSVPGSGRSPGEGNSNPLWYFYLENSKDREAWRALVHALQRVRHNWVTNTFMLHIPREIAKIAKLLLLLGFYSIFRNYWYPLTILSRRSFDLPKYMPNISFFFFFFVRNVPLWAVQSQSNCFCYKGVVGWFSQHCIVYSATKLKTITVNMTGISLFCLGYTVWSWAMGIMLNVQTHTYPHIQEMVNQNER